MNMPDKIKRIGERYMPTCTACIRTEVIHCESV